MTALLRSYLSVWLSPPSQPKYAATKETSHLPKFRFTSDSRSSAKLSIAPSSIAEKQPIWKRWRSAQTTSSQPHFPVISQLQQDRINTRESDRSSNPIKLNGTFVTQSSLQTWQSTTQKGKNSKPVRNKRKSTSAKRQTTSFNFDYGYGLVDAAAAVARGIGQARFSQVPDIGGSDWDLDMVKAPEVWAKGYTGQKVVVAVLDTGVDYTHPDLNNNIWVNSNEIAHNGIDDDGNGFVDDVRGWNFVDADSNDPMDYDSHGTHVAGTIAAGNNGFGVTGVAYDAKIMPVRVIGGSDDSSIYKFDANVAAGIRYAVQNGADVLSLSIGSNLSDPAMRQTEAALKYARSAGVVAVMASGNERLTAAAMRPIEPAFYAMRDLGIAVGAVNRRRVVADFSNPAGNRRLDFVVAPGVEIRSTVLNGSYSYYSGTSMATPHVSGTVALMLSANPNLTPSEVESILTSTAVRQKLVSIA
jgi:subtilisin family serine protease